MSSDLRQTQRDLKSSEQESHHRLLELEVLYRTASVGLGFLDHELRYVRLNEALAGINGLPVEEHIGRYAIEINPDLAKVFVPMMAQVIESKEPLLNIEISSTRPQRTWMANFHPVSNAQTFGVSVVFQDITALKETEDISTRFGLIVRSSDDAIISISLHGVITSWNPAAETMFGYSAQEVMGKAISILASSRTSNEIPDILGRLQEFQGFPQGKRVESIHRRKDGRYIDVLLSVSPIHDRHGRLIGASEIIRDITQQKRAQAALLRTNEELRQFAFAAAHDLQEPLRNIGLRAEILLEARQGQYAESIADEQTQSIIESAGRMQTLIKDLLEYTEVVDIQGEQEKVTDCNEACRTALGNLAAAIADCAADISVAPLPTVVAQRTHFIQLFQNLIGNALKYRAKERSPQIHISAERADDHWIFSVTDNGIGIAPEYHERIFGVFKRLHGRDIPGTGIGLAICKRIVDHLRGRLWLESKVGEGSTFSFSLPDC
jgi:PAS domain S-box-containing protein